MSEDYRKQSGASVVFNEDGSVKYRVKYRLLDSVYCWTPSFISLRKALPVMVAGYMTGEVR